MSVNKNTQVIFGAPTYQKNKKQDEMNESTFIYPKYGNTRMFTDNPSNAPIQNLPSSDEYFSSNLLISKYGGMYKNGGKIPKGIKYWFNMNNPIYAMGGLEPMNGELTGYSNDEVIHAPEMGGYFKKRK